MNILKFKILWGLREDDKYEVILNILVFEKLEVFEKCFLIERNIGFDLSNLNNIPN